MNFKHGEYINGKHSPEATAYNMMIQRCYNKNSKDYENYGGRGIVVCERWLSGFSNFLEDIGRKPTKQHSLDRINSNGNYEKSNCRWATALEQARNRRICKLITYNGVTKTLQDWCNDLGLKYPAIYNRIYIKKYPVELSLETPHRGSLILKNKL